MTRIAEVLTGGRWGMRWGGTVRGGELCDVKWLSGKDDGEASACRAKLMEMLL